MIPVNAICGRFVDHFVTNGTPIASEASDAVSSTNLEQNLRQAVYLPSRQNYYSVPTTHTEAE